MTEIMVNVTHMREAKLCSRGARQWFAAHKISWDDFITKGLPISVIENTDALGKLVADIARKEHEDDR